MINNSKILIFGAAGFLGTYLIDALKIKGYDIIASDINTLGQEYYDKKQIPFYNVDITKTEEFKKLPKLQYAAVIHLAAMQPANVSSNTYDPRGYISVNVLGTLNILDFCRETKSGKIIYATSHRNTQGFWKEKQIITENDGRSIKYNGQYSMFSISETAAQDCILHYMEEYGLKGIILRLPPVYGYGPHTEIFMDGKPIKTGFQIFIDNAMEGKPIELWGDCNKGRDIIYVKDVVTAFASALNNNSAKGLYNISSGYKLTLKEEAETIVNLFWVGQGAPVIVEKPEKDNNIEEFVYDISKAKRELNWKPEYSFKDMLFDIIEESKNKRYEYLIAKRKKMINENN